jgi:hypothetical protein
MEDPGGALAASSDHQASRGSGTGLASKTHTERSWVVKKQKPAPPRTWRCDKCGRDLELEDAWLQYKSVPEGGGSGFEPRNFQIVCHLRHKSEWGTDYDGDGPLDWWMGASGRRGFYELLPHTTDRLGWIRVFSAIQFPEDDLFDDGPVEHSIRKAGRLAEFRRHRPPSDEDEREAAE